MYVRPSANNLHTFTAAENSCFFDICLPNYTQSSHLRKITYFKDTNLFSVDGAMPLAEPDFNLKKSVITDLEYYTSVPQQIPGFGITELSYRGSI
jgi:hypothetical protein